MPVLSKFHVRKAEYRQIAERLRDLAMVARHPEIQAEMVWLADSYERLAERMDENESLFRGDAIPRSEMRDTAARD